MSWWVSVLGSFMKPRVNLIDLDADPSSPEVRYQLKVFVEDYIDRLAKMEEDHWIDMMKRKRSQRKWLQRARESERLGENRSAKFWSKYAAEEQGGINVHKEMCRNLKRHIKSENEFVAILEADSCVELIIAKREKIKLERERMQTEWLGVMEKWMLSNEVQTTQTTPIEHSDDLSEALSDSSLSD